MRRAISLAAPLNVRKIPKEAGEQIKSLANPEMRSPKLWIMKDRKREKAESRSSGGQQRFTDDAISINSSPDSSYNILVSLRIHLSLSCLVNNP